MIVRRRLPSGLYRAVVLRTAARFSADILGPLESLGAAGIANRRMIARRFPPTVAGQPYRLQRIFPTFVTAVTFDIFAPLANQVLLGFSADIRAPLESRSSIAIDISAPIESATTVMARILGPIESGGATVIVFDVPAPLESLRSLSSAIRGPLESFGTSFFTRDIFGPLTSRADILADAIGPIESLIVSRSDVVGPLESQAVFYRDFPGPLESQRVVSGDLFGLIETGTVLILPTMFLGLIESGMIVQADFPGPLENIGIFQSTFGGLGLAAPLESGPFPTLDTTRSQVNIARVRVVTVPYTFADITAQPFDPLPVGAIDTFGFDFSASAGAATIVSSRWSVTFDPRYTGAFDEMPPARLIASWNPPVIYTVNPIDHRLQGWAGVYTLALVGAFPLSAVGGIYTLAVEVVLSDTRVLHASSRVLCAPYRIMPPDFPWRPY
jgi:hypothetical protein